MEFISCSTTGEKTYKLWKYINENQLEHSVEKYYETTLFTIGATAEEQKEISKITPVYELDY